ncbi:MAG: hypothetical protein WCK48_01715 [bacterium]
MHPLTTFPQLLTYGLLAPFLLRVCVGLILVWLGYERYQKPYKWSSLIYFVTSLCLFVGLYTQITSIVGILVLIFDFKMTEKSSSVSMEKKMLYILAGIILFSLLFTGPGFLARDYPL